MNTTQKRHRRLPWKQPAYMDGKRVKPRLRRIVYFSVAVLCTVALLSVAIAMLLLRWLTRLPGVDDENVALWGTVCVLLVMFLGQLAARTALRALCIRLGCMTAEEAEFFRQRGAGWCWPVSWLEPLPGHPAARGNVTTECPSIALRAAQELDRLGEWEQAIEHYQFVVENATDKDKIAYARGSLRRLQDLLALQRGEQDGT